MKISLYTAILFSIVLVCGCADTDGEDAFMEQRYQMVEEQVARRGVRDERVLQAMREVKRHLFVPEQSRADSYQDHPLSIGYKQTISQPYIVGYMTEAVRLKEGDRVLEIGTGSGYQAAVLASIAKEVYSVEIVKQLAESARDRLKNLKYDNVHVRHGDGYQGWEEHAPFDAVIVTAAPEDIPIKLIHQMAVGGRMVVPVGSIHQELLLITKTKDGYDRTALLPVRFVPMIKEAGR